MKPLLAAQFLSAFADNVLFVLAIALLHRADPHGGLEPLAQQSFLFAYVLLAPFVGPFADAHAKSRVMLAANALKIAGSALMLAGVHPVLSYALVGAGAAAYSPAKYGILVQMFDAKQLVRANSWIEGSTIFAILAGVVLGGWLADRDLHQGLGVALLLYLGAAGFNLLIPRLPAERPLSASGAAMLRDFWRDLSRLWRVRDARFSMLGTSLFWGTGATLRLLLFAWVPVALLATDLSTPSDLMGALSIGIAAGALGAGAVVRLAHINRVLWAGLLLGPLVLALAAMHDFTAAAALLFALGACGGFFAVPLNALLQERGHESVGAGRALAIQNFFENASMLVMVGLYGVALRAGGEPVALAQGFGAFILVGMALLAWSRWRRA
jgi:LPLT family lysophospholipid transporter-like MFS transporter